MFRKGVFITVALAVVISLVAVVCGSVVSIRQTYDGMMQDFSGQVNSILAQAAENELYVRTNEGFGVVFGYGEKSLTIPDSLLSSDPTEIKSISIFKFRNETSVDRVLSNKEPVRDTLTGFNILAFRLFLSQAMEYAGIDRPYAVRLIRQSEETISVTVSPSGVGSLPDTSIKIIGEPHRYDQDTIYAESLGVSDALTFSCDIKEVPLPLKAELSIENPHRDFLGQMGGIIITVSTAVLLLIFSFIYLVLTIFRQKTLEQMRKDFTHNVTHELKTPVAAACAVNEALLDYSVGEDPAKRREYLELQRKSLDSLSRMIESILDVSLQESEAFVLHKEQCSLRDILSEQCSVLETKYGRSLDVEVDLQGGEATEGRQEVSDGLPSKREDSAEGEILLDADRFHLSHALFNLLDNAVKYCSSEPRIQVRGRREGRMVVISVQDNGIGIPSSERMRIFEKYYRITSGDVQDTRGSGLGLYYCKMVAQKHGGSVEVTGALGGGSVFTVYLKA